MAIRKLYFWHQNVMCYTKTSAFILYFFTSRSACQNWCWILGIAIIFQIVTFLTIINLQVVIAIIGSVFVSNCLATILHQTLPQCLFTSAIKPLTFLDILVKGHVRYMSICQICNFIFFCHPVRIVYCLQISGQMFVFWLLLIIHVSYAIRPWV